MTIMLYLLSECFHTWASLLIDYVLCMTWSM